MNTAGIEAAKEYIARDMDITHVGSDVVFGTISAAFRQKLRHQPSIVIGEAAALVLDEISLGNGAARDRYKKLVEWKGRAEGRYISLMVPRDLNPALLTEFRDVLTVVAYPLAPLSDVWVTAKA